MSCATSGAPHSDSSFAKVFAGGSGYTLVNLHPDEIRKKLYAVNYQQGGLIPLCSEVVFTGWTTNFTGSQARRMTFRVLSTGTEYAYDYHKAAVVPLEEHLAQYFGPECDPQRLQSLPALDRRGVKAGRVEVGMTREGTLLAIGYPPPHATPTLDATQWRYWRNRFNTMLVVFDADGRISQIRD
jgi:hypothetical protein